MSISANGRAPMALPSDVRLMSAEEFAAIEEAERAEAVRRRISDAGIPERYLSADISRCSEAAAAYAADCAEGSAMNLVVTGEAGDGKTYTACAVLKDVMRRRPALARFADEPSILCEMRDTWGSKTREDEVMCRYAAPWLLVLDDLGRAKHTDRTLEMLWRLVNRRYSANRPTVFTCQYDRHGLATRFQAGGGDAETAQAIIRRVMEDGNAVMTRAVIR